MHSFHASVPPVLCQDPVRRVEAGQLVGPQAGQGSSGVTMSDVKEEERNGQPAGAHTAPLGNELISTGMGCGANDIEDSSKHGAEHAPGRRPTSMESGRTDF